MGIRPWPLALLVLALPAHAVSVSASIDLGWREYDSRETTSGGFVLNRDRGGLPGVALTLAADGALGRWSVQVAHDKGDVVYTGLTQLAVPIRTTTALDVKRLALRWSPPWEPKLWRVSFAPQVELSYQLNKRAIRESPLSLPLTEKLDATSLRGGLLARLPLAASWSLQAEGQLSRPLAQHLKVNSFGVYDNFTLRPRARTSRRLALGAVWQPAAHWQGGLWVSREHWRFGDSDDRDVTRDGVVVGSANYPGSVQRLDGFSLRIEYQF